MSRWTKTEENFLKHNGGHIPISEIAKKLDRSLRSVKSKMFLLGIKNIDRRLKSKLEFGSKYGMFTVMGIIIKIINHKKYLYYICKCICGQAKNVPKTNLTNGSSKSCGCVGRAKNTLSPGESSINERWSACNANAESRNIFLI